MHVSRAGMISRLGMYLALVIVGLSLGKIAATHSTHYEPLLFLGLVVGITSTPFYYFYKNQDKQPYDSQAEALKALAAAGKNLAKNRHKKLKTDK